MILPPQTMHYYKGEFPQKNHTYKTLAACFIPPKSGSHLITPVSVQLHPTIINWAANAKWHLVQLQLRCSRFRWRREPAKQEAKLDSWDFIKTKSIIPIGSMYGIFTYIYHTNQPNVGKYTIHGWCGIVIIQDFVCKQKLYSCQIPLKQNLQRDVCWRPTRLTI